MNKIKFLSKKRKRGSTQCKLMQKQTKSISEIKDSLSNTEIIVTLFNTKIKTFGQERNEMVNSCFMLSNKRK